MQLCECGCGEPAPLATRSNATKGIRRGETPLRFVAGHQQRHRTNLARHEPTDGGYTSPCWRWTGSFAAGGYGLVQVAGVHKNAHRAMYEAEVGPVSPELHVDHLCRNKWCVNPAHLEAVTPAENLRRRWAGHKRITHCLRGHLLPDVSKRKGYACPTCSRERARVYREKNRVKLRDWMRAYNERKRAERRNALDAPVGSGPEL